MEKKHILVLEDEAATRTFFEEVLGAAGYRVTGVSNGAMALKATRSDPPDLIVSDLGVPGLDGYQFVTMLKRTMTFKAPIIVVSGRIREEDAQAALAAGADTFLLKPVDRQALLSAVAERLEPKAAG